MDAFEYDLHAARREGRGLGGGGCRGGGFGGGIREREPWRSALGVPVPHKRARVRGRTAVVKPPRW